MLAKHIEVTTERDVLGARELTVAALGQRK
jgi:hypothetical protein